MFLNKQHYELKKLPLNVQNHKNRLFLSVYACLFFVLLNYFFQIFIVLDMLFKNLQLWLILLVLLNLPYSVYLISSGSVKIKIGKSIYFILNKILYVHDRPGGYGANRNFSHGVTRKKGIPLSLCIQNLKFSLNIIQYCLNTQYPIIPGEYLQVFVLFPDITVSYIRKQKKNDKFGVIFWKIIESQIKSNYQIN